MVAVKYKYPNGNEVIIDKADSYNVETLLKQPVGWQAVGKYYDVAAGGERRFVTPEYPVNSGVIVESIAYRFNKPNKASWVLELSNGTRRNLLRNGISPVWADNFVQSEGSKGVLLPVGVFPPSMSHWYTPTDQNGIYDYNTKIYEALNPVIQGWWICRLTNKYKLDIFQGNELVFTRTELYPPTYVEIFGGKECPQDTCPLLCNGTQVCCYGSNGIATDSFLLSESIYK